MDWELILSSTFILSVIISGIRLGLPVMVASLGELITERGGVMNLGLEGIMSVGGIAGFLVALVIQDAAWVQEIPWIAPWLGGLAGILAGILLGLILAFLCVTLQADQVVAGVTLVVLGTGVSVFVYRLMLDYGVVDYTISRINRLEALSIPGLSKIPFLGEIFFTHDLFTYVCFLLVAIAWFFLYRTTWGFNIRAVGENPAAADTSGVNVNAIRYLAIIIGTGLGGFAGAVLTVQQLGVFREGIMGGRGWIAVALVIFARWKPGLVMLGALFFGLADSVQFRIQALSTLQRGDGALPYELLLMLPYALTLIALYIRGSSRDAPAALGKPYKSGAR